MPIELKHLRYAEVAERCGSFRKAADVLALTGEPASDCSRSMVLWSERIIVALPEDHPPAANEIIHWTDLKRERFLLSERDPGPEIQDMLVAKLSSSFASFNRQTTNTSSLLNQPDKWMSVRAPICTARGRASLSTPAQVLSARKAKKGTCPRRGCVAGALLALAFDSTLFRQGT